MSQKVCVLYIAQVVTQTRKCECTTHALAHSLSRLSNSCHAVLCKLDMCTQRVAGNSWSHLYPCGNVILDKNMHMYLPFLFISQLYSSCSFSFLFVLMFLIMVSWLTASNTLMMMADGAKTVTLKKKGAWTLVYAQSLTLEDWKAYFAFYLYLTLNLCSISFFVCAHVFIIRFDCLHIKILRALNLHCLHGNKL